MKKVIITSIALLSLFASKAQISKTSNSLNLNAALGYIQSNNGATTIKQINLSLQPSFEHFVADNLSIGVSLNLGRNSANVKSYYSESDYTISLIGIELLMKKYWFINPNIAFNMSPAFASNRIFQNSINTNTGSSKSESNLDGWLYGANLRVGALIMLKTNLALEAQTNLLGYSKETYSKGLDAETFGFLNFQSNLQLGIKFLFNKPVQ